MWQILAWCTVCVLQRFEKTGQWEDKKKSGRHPFVLSASPQWCVELESCHGISGCRVPGNWLHTWRWWLHLWFVISCLPWLLKQKRAIRSLLDCQTGHVSISASELPPALLNAIALSLTCSFFAYIDISSPTWVCVFSPERNKREE